jgi:hypothetical protein
LELGKTEVLGTEVVNGSLYQPQLTDEKNGKFGEMIIYKGNKYVRRKPTPLPLCPP